MGNKNPKPSKFEKIFRLLSDPDLFDIQWPAAINAAQTSAELDRLATLVASDPARLDDLFVPRYRMVSDVDGMIALATAYPDRCDTIVRLTGKIQPCEDDIYRLVNFNKDWSQGLLADLLEKKTDAYNEAIERMTDAEDERDQAEFDLGEVAAATVKSKDEAAEIARQAQYALNRVRNLATKLAEQRANFEKADVAYVQVTEEVDALGLQVADLTKKIFAEEGEIASMLPDIDTRDIMIAERFLDSYAAEPEPALEQRISPEEESHPVAMDDQPPAPAPVRQPEPPHPVASDSWLVQRLRLLRPKNVLRRFNAYLDAE